MVKVYAWPPVCCRGHEFTLAQPVSRSRSLISGRTYVSSAAVPRRVAALQVSGMSAGFAAAGYMEMLSRELEGGLHLVRVLSKPMVHRKAYWPLRSVRGKTNLYWTDRFARLDWEEVQEDIEGVNGLVDLEWFEGTEAPAEARTSRGYPALRVTNLPPDRQVAWPSELVRVGSSVARVMAPAWSNADGAALIRLDTALDSGLALIGASESVVYRMIEMPRAMRPLVGDWSYDIALEEVFEAETDGFVEVDPW